MKKKGMALGALLMAVAITGYSVSGTYAKYISSVDLTDEARVAKWELKATGNGKDLEETNNIDLFANSYVKDGKTYVKAVNDTDKIVAPGTQGTYELALTGEMETAYTLNFIVNNTQDIVVYYTTDAEGNVDEMSTVEGELTNAKEYHPLRYTVEYLKDGAEVITDPTKKIVGKTSAQVKTMLDAYNAMVNAGKPFGPGKMANLSYTITWAWDTRNTTDGSGNALDKDNVDKLDTFAGQNVANLKKAIFNVTVKAEQVAEDYSKAPVPVQP